MKISVRKEIIRMFELSPIDLGDDTLYLRVEILREFGNPNQIHASILRKEFYRIQPTFPQKGGVPHHEPSDEVLFMEDKSALTRPASRSDGNVEKLLEEVVKQLEERFSLT